VARRAKSAVKDAKLFGYDVAIVDTAGRLHVDEVLMDEVARIRDATEPDEILFVADAMTGQDAVRSAEAFGARLPSPASSSRRRTATRAAAPRSRSRRSSESR
jgi:signal recognition particle GTPase